MQDCQVTLLHDCLNSVVQSTAECCLWNTLCCFAAWQKRHFLGWGTWPNLKPQIQICSINWVICSIAISHLLSICWALQLKIYSINWAICSIVISCLLSICWASQLKIYSINWAICSIVISHLLSICWALQLKIWINWAICLIAISHLLQQSNFPP